MTNAPFLIAVDAETAQMSTQEIPGLIVSLSSLLDWHRYLPFHDVEDREALNDSEEMLMVIVDRVPDEADDAYWCTLQAVADMLALRALVYSLSEELGGLAEA